MSRRKPQAVINTIMMSDAQSTSLDETAAGVWRCCAQLEQQDRLSYKVIRIKAVNWTDVIARVYDGLRAIDKL